MIEYVKGNMMEAPVQALVNTVNTVGVMGKGIALQFKEIFPQNFKVYLKACRDKSLQTGMLLTYREQTFDGEKIIINFPTKTEWYQKSKYEYIETGLIALVDVIKSENVESIAIPPLGCGNGGLKWDIVRPMLEKYLAPLENVNIFIYEPNEKVREILKQQEVKKEVKLTPARAMLLYSMFYYEALGERSSLFVANKLAYFLQRLGEKSLKLKFEAHHYGPYSNQVEHVLHNINGKYLKGLEQMNAKAFEPLDLQYDKIKEISEYVKKELSAEQIARLKNLISLIEGFQSALSLEVLATVDFVRCKKNTTVLSEIFDTIQDWSPRKKRLFKEKYVMIALEHLLNYSKKLEFQ